MTTRAVNENRRPPLTTLATRLISTTRSFSSCSAATSTAAISGSSRSQWTSELEPSFSRGIGERLDPTVEEIAAAIEYDLRNARVLCRLGKQLAASGRLLALRALHPLAAEREPAGRGQRLARLVVDQLGEAAPVRAEHDEARPFRRAGDALAHPPVAPCPQLVSRRSHC